MSKLTDSQLKVLTTIKEAKKATKKGATANGGNHTTVAKLVDLGLLDISQPTKKVTEITYSLSANGKAALKPAKAPKAAKAACPA